MKRVASVVIASILAISLVGCSGNKHEGEAKTPSGSIIQKGREYQDVIDDFEKKGFTNIKTEELDDLITGWLVKDGEVESVSVAEDVDYSPDVWYPNDVKVIITYHTFPADDISEETEIDHFEEGDDTSTEVNEAVTEQPANESSEQNDQETDVEILTIENNKDLATLFANGEDVELCKEFVAKYKGRTIEFDGSIAYMSLHEDYDTRYDFLIYAGDYNKDSSNGSPAMQFKDASVSDLHLTGDNIPEAIGMGDNLHIIATVDDLINDYLIILNPISIEVR
jgi:hypothetical protein